VTLDLSFLEILDPPFFERPLAIFDRDGTLNIDTLGYTHRIANYELLEGVKPALLFLTNNQINIAIATNQSGVGKGLYSSSDFKRFNDYLKEDLSQEGIKIQGTAACFHLKSQNCLCRKPNPLQLDTLKESIPNNGKVSFFGDKSSDMMAALNAGVLGLSTSDSPIEVVVKKWVAEIDDL
jgi:histidinol-phosphate phosphatase family protein